VSGERADIPIMKSFSRSPRAGKRGPGVRQGAGKPSGRGRSRTSGYTTKIIKAGALLPDTKALLSFWDPDATVRENLQRAHAQNLLGKTSRSRVEDILNIFRQRYLSDESVAKALARLVRSSLDRNAVDRVLYFHTTRADSLLRDIVVEVLVPQWSSGVLDIDASEIQRVLKAWVAEGRTSSAWGDYTIRRVAQGLLSTLRDFGVLEGAVNKRIAPSYLPVYAFAYIAFYLRQHQPSGSNLIDLPDWKLYFLPPEGVERFLVEAHQHGLLEYHAAGSVIRLTFPVSTLEEYADVLTQGSNRSS